MAIATKVSGDIKNSSFIREMFERGRRMKAEFGDDNVFDLSLGNPNATPPPAFFDAVKAVAAEHLPARHRYMPNAGFDESRVAVAQFLSQEYRTEIDAANVILTTGAAGGLNVTLRAILDHGDEVIVLAPFFSEYRLYIEQAGGVMITAQTDDKFQPDIDAIERAINSRTRAIIVNSPNNPTGAVYSDATCKSLAMLLSKHEVNDQPIYLITDDPYRRVLYDLDWCPTPVAHYHRTLIVSSYSKDLSIAGERVGYIAVPRSMPEQQLLISALTMLNRTLGYVNSPAFMQRVVARCASARCDIGDYRNNRDVLCKALVECGYELNVPPAALYAFPKTPIADDREFVEILVKHRVLAVPGRGFGRPGHMRLSFAVEPKVVQGSLLGFRAAMQEARNLLPTH